jgi:hypothetical protein
MTRSAEHGADESFVYFFIPISNTFAPFFSVTKLYQQAVKVLRTVAVCSVAVPFPRPGVAGNCKRQTANQFQAFFGFVLVFFDFF